MTQPREAHVHSAMQMLATTRLQDLTEAYGVPETDRQLLQADALWNAGDRPTVRRTMDSILYGALDALGLPRFVISAEYIAAWIALVVSPINWMTMCAYYDHAVAAADIRGSQEDVPFAEHITAPQLHALVTFSANCVCEGGPDHQTYKAALARSMIILPQDQPRPKPKQKPRG